MVDAQTYLANVERRRQEEMDQRRQAAQRTLPSWFRLPNYSSNQVVTSDKGQYISDFVQEGYPPGSFPPGYNWNALIGSASATPGRAMMQGKGSFSGLPNTQRVNRYFADQLGDRDVSYLKTKVVTGTETPDETNDLLLQVANGNGRGIAGALDIAIDLSLNDPDSFMALQTQLVMHGFLQDAPTYGMLDGQTKDAIVNMTDQLWQLGGEKSATEYLRETWDRFQDGIWEARRLGWAEVNPEAAARIKQLRDNLDQMKPTITLTSSDNLEGRMQDMAVETLGRRLTKAETERLISQTHAEERKSFYDSPAYKQYQTMVRQMNEEIAQYRNEWQGTDNDLDAFMGAIMMQESGRDPNAVNKHSGAFGLFQFMPSTWQGAAKSAGLDPDDRSAENQVAVAKNLMQTYYTMFGQDWRKVAIAWYAGPNSDAIRDPNFGTKKDPRGYPSIQGYADQIMERMQNGGQLNVDQAYASADAGSLGAGTPSQVDVDAWWKTMRNSQLGIKPDGTPTTDLDPAKDPASSLSDLSDYNPGQITEFEDFDPYAYLQKEVRRTGGVDADTWEYVQRAQEFFSLLGAR